MYWRFFIVLAVLFCGFQSFGDEPAEPDLLNEALQEIAKSESKKKTERELAEKNHRRQARQTEPSTPTPSSSRKNFDFGDVVVTISERELEETPEVYLQDEDDSSPVLNVKKKPRRRTSSIPSQEQPKREPSSE